MYFFLTEQRGLAAHFIQSAVLPLPIPQFARRLSGRVGGQATNSLPTMQHRKKIVSRET